LPFIKAPLPSIYSPLPYTATEQTYSTLTSFSSEDNAMLIRLPLLLLLFIITNASLASIHPSKTYGTPTLRINQHNPSLTTNETVEDFSTLLQRRILQILAHQLIDDNAQTNTQNNNVTNTHYKTKTFSVSIDTVNTAFYRVSIKDSLQNKETLIKIPR